MKAKVKATGEIVEVAYHGLGVYVDMNQWDKEYQFDEIVVLDNGDPDYWTRLEHQAAIAAMQAQMAPNCLDSPEGVACTAYAYAHALVEKMKEER